MSYLTIFQSLGRSDPIRSLFCSSAYMRAWPNSHSITSRPGCSCRAISARNPASSDCRCSGFEMRRKASSGYRVVRSTVRTERPCPWSSACIRSVPNSTSPHHSAGPPTMTSASARRAAALDTSCRFRAAGCCSSRGSRITSSPTFLEEEDGTCLRCGPRPAHGRQSRMPTADGSAEVPEGSISDRETIMQKREPGSAEGRAPANLHLTAVTSFLVATLSQHVHQFFPVGIIKTSPAREHSHVAYLAENQCASQYTGTLLVKMMIKREHMNLGSRHGLLESSQSKFGPGFDPPTPLIDFPPHLGNEARHDSLIWRRNKDRPITQLVRRPRVPPPGRYGWPTIQRGSVPETRKLQAARRRAPGIVT